MEFVQIGEQFINPLHVESITPEVEERTITKANDSRKEKVNTIALQLYSGRKITIENAEIKDVVKAVDEGLQNIPHY